MGKIRKFQVDWNDGLFNALEHWSAKKIIGDSQRNALEELKSYETNFLLLKRSLRSLRNVHEGARTAVLQMETTKVQNRLLDLQHPQNCRKKKKLICNLNKKCGFGCQIHHVLMCLVAAVALNRTMILVSRPWNYSPNGWETFFLPVTHCQEKSFDMDTLPVMNVSDPLTRSRHKLLLYPFFPDPDPQWLPFALPDDFPGMVHRVHENPSLWWISQGLTYLWRLQPNVSDLIRLQAGKVTPVTPFVGIHVRRTDKIQAEARIYDISEYAKLADKYWDENNITSADQKRVYIASDDPSVIKNFRERYGKNYTVYCNANARKLKRYSEPSLLDLLYDVHFLSKSEHLVCTFSSLICKMAYELKQTSRDEYKSFDSLDHHYWLPGSGGRFYSTTMDNIKDLHFRKGDMLFDVRSLKNGFAVGSNMRTKLNGTFPFHKVEELFYKGNYTLF
ncbi:alpha-(1,6)-fucosyltransferase-like isoform X2 [Paramacrobiotus metropolitanus]|nr:alpha-(1,6)-fucosyltransferase-like isoform X2 [Paramacrobiotus metropolitanus]XP_055343895.1 alpha-(1,6)-fucosyltransferase-like isoform X2 [Paramacrobiotus metropolitanus]